MTIIIFCKADIGITLLVGDGKMITISICDDNRAVLSVVKHILERYCISKNIDAVINEYSVLDEACIKELSKSTIVFLDIEMGKIDGITAARMIRDLSATVKIVYLTSFAKYSLQGYDAMASGYLLKTNKDMDAVITEKMDGLLRFIKRDSLLIKFDDNNRSISIPIVDVILFETGEKGMVLVKTKDDKYYKYRATLKQLARQYGEYGFLRVNRRMLINMRFIIKISGYTVYLNNGESYQTTDINYRQLIETFVAWEGNQ